MLRATGHARMVRNLAALQPRAQRSVCLTGDARLEFLKCVSIERAGQ